MITSALIGRFDLIPLLSGSAEGEAALTQLMVHPAFVANWRESSWEDIEWPAGIPRWLPKVALDFRTVLAESESRVVWIAPAHPLPLMIVFYGVARTAVVGITDAGAQIAVVSRAEAAALLAARSAAADEANSDWQIYRWIGADLDVRLSSDDGRVTIQARDPEQAGALSRAVDFDELVTQLAAGHP